MATGACGINCDTCRLNIIGACSTCGAGTSPAAAQKIAAQERLLGAACAILACARANRLAFCMRDCDMFPCENFHNGPYPFSQGYLAMQQRRRASRRPIRAPYGDDVQIPPEYWAQLQTQDSETLGRAALGDDRPSDGLVLQVLHESILVDIANRRLCAREDREWQVIQDPFLELLLLVYLLNVKPVDVSGELCSVKDLKDAVFFQGPHALDVKPLLQRYGEDPAAFGLAAERLGGEAVDLADAAYRLWPFPKVPVYYLLWAGDDEFAPTLTILFDKTIEKHLAADAIWGTVNMVSQALLRH